MRPSGVRPASVRCISGLYPVIVPPSLRPPFGVCYQQRPFAGFHLARCIRRKSWAQNLKPFSKLRQLNSGRVAHPVRAGGPHLQAVFRLILLARGCPISRVFCAREKWGLGSGTQPQGHSRHAYFRVQYSPVVDPPHFAVRIRRKLLHF